jgi:endonuclease-3 related protein
VVDAYTRRLLARLGADWAQRASYQALQAHWMAALPSDTALYNEAHALIVQHAKTHCRAKPRCADCPLLTHCPFGSGC